MGKKRIIRTEGGGVDAGRKSRALSRVTKKRVEEGVLYIVATYNNTKLTLTDTLGNTLMWSSSGSLGFKGAKKGTPFAAAKVGELIGEKAAMAGVKGVSVQVKGVGAGRESALRGFVGKGLQLSSIKDTTPVPHNGPKPPKPRRV